MDRITSFLPGRLFLAEQDSETQEFTDARGPLGSSASTMNVTESPTQGRYVRLERLNRRWAATLLFTGSGCGLLGFSFSTCLGIFKFAFGPGEDCFDGRPCPSGWNYMPETVSEMVSQPGEPEGVLFQAFAVIGSLCILISRYPWELRNVNTAQTAACSLAGVRTFIIPVGMILVAWVPVIPQARRTLKDKVAADIHSFGAVCFIIGYMLVEAAALCRLRNRLRTKEKRWRWGALVCTALFTLMFGTIGSVLNSARAGSLEICCADEWVNTTEAFISIYGNASSPGMAASLRLYIRQYGSMVLINTASGRALALKVVEFWTETAAGLAVIFSHSLIWYFCEERHLQISAIEAA